MTRCNRRPHSNENNIFYKMRLKNVHVNDEKTLSITTKQSGFCVFFFPFSSVSIENQKLKSRHFRIQSFRKKKKKNRGISTDDDHEQRPGIKENRARNAYNIYEWIQRM